MSKRKFKGVRYIAKSLSKYLGKQYPNYRAALPKAREVYGKLAESKQKVVLKNILPLARPGRKVKKASPQLDSGLLTPSPYFELQKYPMLITRVSNEVWFTSKIVPTEAGEIQGGTTPSYQTYFAPYVNYINAVAAQYSREESRYETEWRVVCTPPIFNKAKKRWESKIIAIDADGDEADYGFNPKTPDKSPKTPPSVPTPTPKGEAPPKAEETAKKGVTENEIKLVQAETEKIKAEAEKAKQQNINQLLKLFGEGQLSKAEFKELMNKIK